MEKQINNKTESSDFICLHCGENVEATMYDKRNHCNKCLYSLHTDIFPKDNANTCRGLMQPYYTKQNENEELLVVHKCVQCHKTSSAKVEVDDDYSVVLSIIPK